MQMRRFTGLTDGFAQKKLPNLKAAVSPHFVRYNFVRLLQSLWIMIALGGALPRGCAVRVVAVLAFAASVCGPGLRSNRRHVNLRKLNSDTT